MTNNLSILFYWKQYSELQTLQKRTIKKLYLIITIAITINLYWQPVHAEQSVNDIKALVSWTYHWNMKCTGNNFIQLAKDHGHIVDKNPSGCSISNPCILVYHHSHIGVLYSATPPYKIKESNSLCEKGKKECDIPNINNASVVHPKSTAAKFIEDLTMALKKAVGSQLKCSG